ncbi:hypothetical protein [Natrialba aegyptia]|uniref:Uncharacterized protein n=1 Tax=Natrialba aegyptia DSM 13077 TaxID=1227491 RepID=M0B9P4_9EURY|nr:hypothetical protein [Natrialba aegyptia]ELZ07621.1 hypothetical protein C480_06196 [Natrialba aegyptia DSM 13077]
MLSTLTKPAVVLVVGIGLLLNPVYFASDDLTGSGTEITYTVEAIENESDAERVVEFSEQTLRCGTERACALERQIASEGAVEYNGSVQTLYGSELDRWNPYTDAWKRYKLVTIGGEFYIPTTEYRDNVTVLGHENATTMEALDHIAVPSNETTSNVRKAIETGSITLTDQRIPEFERGDPIAHDGDVYYGTTSASNWGLSEGVLLGRLTLFITGGSLIVSAWSRQGR